MCCGSVRLVFEVIFSLTPYSLSAFSSDELSTCCDVLFCACCPVLRFKLRWLTGALVVLTNAGCSDPLAAYAPGGVRGIKHSTASGRCVLHRRQFGMHKL